MSALDRHLQDLATWIRTLSQEPMNWSKVLIVDNRDIVFTYGPPLRLIPRRALNTPEDFTAKFDEFLNAGYGWINLNAAGILDDTLLVVVELPNKPNTASANKPELVPVRLSGPAMRDGTPEWNLARKVVITD